MFYIYRPNSSLSARAIVNALGEARRVRNIDRVRRPMTRGDVVVCWGHPIPQHREAYIPEGVTVIGNQPLRTKFNDIRTLTRAGVPTVEAATTHPETLLPARPARPARPDVNGYNATFNTRYNVLAEAVEQMPDEVMDEAGQKVEPATTALLAAMEAMTSHLLTDPAQLPAEPELRDDGEWLGRLNSHHGGNDLIDPSDNPDFYVKKVNITREWRVHSFDGRSIRAAEKVEREDFEGTPHPWIRSYDLGWRFSYRDGAVRQAHRDLAHRAVRALGLTFGAVDIGEVDGNLIVIEVNRAPGLDGTTPERYARAIQRYVEEGPNPANTEARNA